MVVSTFGLYNQNRYKITRFDTWNPSKTVKDSSTPTARIIDDYDMTNSKYKHNNQRKLSYIPVISEIKPDISVKSIKQFEKLVETCLRHTVVTISPTLYMNR